MKPAAEEDLTQTSLSRMSEMAEKAAKQKKPQASLPLILGKGAAEKLKNVMKGIHENKFRVMQAVFQKM